MSPIQRLHRRVLGVLIVLATCVAAAPAFAGGERCAGITVQCATQSDTCISKQWLENRAGKGDRNYLIFNHEKGIIEQPIPAELEARDGEVFTIVFACTAPQLFDYQIEAIPDDKIAKTTFTSGTASQTVDELVNAASITWRHDEKFPLYRVSVTARKPIARSENELAEKAASAALEAAQGSVSENQQENMPVIAQSFRGGDPFALLEEKCPTCFDSNDSRRAQANYRAAKNMFPEKLKAAKVQYNLYSYTFPVWVRTVGWDLSFSTGFGFSGLEDPKFYLETVEAEGDGTMTEGMGDAMMDGMSDEVKLVRRDRDTQDDFRPDLMALANLQFPSDLHHHGRWGGWLEHFGLSFGVGLGEDSEPRYFFGPSWDLGKHFVLTGGIAGGKITTLPTGQKLNEPLLDGSDLPDTLPKHFETAGFVGIAFRFNQARDEFIGKLSGVQKVVENEKEKKPVATTEVNEDDSQRQSAAKGGRWRFESCTPVDGVALTDGPELSGLAVAGSELVAPFEESRDLAFVTASGTARKVQWGGGGEAEIEGITHHGGRYYLVDECEPTVYEIDLAQAETAKVLTIEGFPIQRTKKERDGKATCQDGLEGIAFNPDHGTLYLLDEKDTDNLKRTSAVIYVGEIKGSKIVPIAGAEEPYRFPLDEGWRYSDITFHTGIAGPELLAIASKVGGYRVMSVPLSAEAPGAPKAEAELVLDLTQDMKTHCKSPNLEGITVGTNGDLYLINDAGKGETTYLVRLAPTI